MSIITFPRFERVATEEGLLRGGLSFGGLMARLAAGSFVAVFCGVLGYVAAVKLVDFLL